MPRTVKNGHAADIAVIRHVEPIALADDVPITLTPCPLCHDLVEQVSSLTAMVESLERRLIDADLETLIDRKYAAILARDDDIPAQYMAKVLEGARGWLEFKKGGKAGGFGGALMPRGGGDDGRER